MEASLEALQPGTHAALIYRTRAEQFATICPFISLGIKRKERCLYIANDNSVPLVLERFSKYGIDVTGTQKTGALVVATKKDTYHKHGGFDPGKMVADLKSEVEKALALGFTGLRATGEMTWALEAPLALEQLIAYEAELHKQFSTRLTGLCQYDETRFSASVLSDIIRIHPKLVIKGRVIMNQFLSAPEHVLAGSLPHVSVQDLIPAAA